MKRVPVVRMERQALVYTVHACLDRWLPSTIHYRSNTITCAGSLHSHANNTHSLVYTSTQNLVHVQGVTSGNAVAMLLRRDGTPQALNDAGQHIPDSSYVRMLCLLSGSAQLHSNCPAYIAPPLSASATSVLIVHGCIARF